MTVLLVLFGAAVGAPLRYLTDRFVQTRHDSVFPWGTLVVNITGCLVLGALSGAGVALPSSLLVLLGTGFCGALTTYSTFSYETVRLIEDRAYLYALLNVAISVVAGLGAVLVGYTVISALVGH
ncbi:MAG TPA: fluoride efflux transporter CrcB [Pseudonocardiaceae bacterium]|nr:fluoride efflux transporter CrcB [Pseudonocardiaceae bacterium]